VPVQELPAAPSLSLTQGHCELATDYVKKKNTLRLRLVITTGKYSRVGIFRG